MNVFRSIMLLVAGLFAGIPAFAQESEISFLKGFTSMSSGESTLVIVMAVILLVIVLLMVILIYLVTFLKQVLQLENPALAAEPSWWEQFNERFISGKMKPIEEEKDLALDHSYDGIVELDNFMPPWLKYLFYVTIVFGVVYVLNYLVFGIGKMQIEEYEQELYVAQVEAEARQALAVSIIDETNVQFDATGPSLAAGQAIYQNNCVACHAVDGGGGVGPNLTDEYWLHGGSIEDVFKVVKYGVIEKGMIPWQDQLSPEEMQQVSSYILTLVGTTPANPKAPQGDKYEQTIEEPIDALTEDEQGVEEV
ncbi:cbb3-type cytochrome c oxidase N-terminal domain-containing protein [Lunatimonas salinarum]|uniref:cbb3-type cytochrome c oxidase N-terminal domain-containing protein n=1 Tax=Lunatimonas salinarum TaxID=1774590 RepID=UPI001AE005F2|nr:cbb3-type cytochrome c oxidase N-terminal domain-containing protein [Lunatimonas salinarum]